MNCRKEIFCQSVPFYLEKFRSNKGNLEKKNVFFVKHLCFAL